jgi:hypothetical protein
MLDLLKDLSQARLDSLFVLAGLLFLAVAVLGKISGAIQAGKTGRLVSAGLAPVLIAAGVWMHASRGESNDGVVPPADKPAVVPTDPTRTSAPAVPVASTTSPPRPAPTSSAASKHPVDSDESVTLAGAWGVTQTSPENVVLSGTLQLTQRGHALEGDMEWMGHRPGKVVRGSIDGDHVEFVVRYSDPDLQGVYEGTLKSPRRIEGSTKGGGAQARWSATRP